MKTIVQNTETDIVIHWYYREVRNAPIDRDGNIPHAARVDTVIIYHQNGTIELMPAEVEQMYEELQRVKLQQANLPAD
jgi:hypothetical protein